MLEVGRSRTRDFAVRNRTRRARGGCHEVGWQVRQWYSLDKWPERLDVFVCHTSSKRNDVFQGRLVSVGERRRRNVGFAEKSAGASSVLDRCFLFASD